jgi:hypothetical protein
VFTLWSRLACDNLFDKQGDAGCGPIDEGAIPMKPVKCGLMACAALMAQAAAAQPNGSVMPQRHFTDAEISAIAVPSLAFNASKVDPADYEKYFIFHRAGTSFAEAHADITECDALASGISIYRGMDAGQMASNMVQHGVLAGAIGGAIANVMVDAIFGSAERRKARRVNLRNCMYFKGYDRYGLEKELWQSFNFEEGLSKTDADVRAEKLLVQARVASGPAPQLEKLVP